MKETKCILQEAKAAVSSLAVLKSEETAGSRVLHCRISGSLSWLSRLGGFCHDEKARGSQGYQ